MGLLRTGLCDSVWLLVGSLDCWLEAGQSRIGNFVMGFAAIVIALCVWGVVGLAMNTTGEQE